MKLNGNSRGSHSAPRHEKPSRARGEDCAPGRDEAAAAGENLTYEPAAEGGYEPAPAKRRGSGAKRAAAILGAIAGYALGTLSPMWLSLSLSFAAGAMYYVVFGELMPEAILMFRSKLPALATVVGILVGLMIIYV